MPPPPPLGAKIWRLAARRHWEPGGLLPGALCSADLAAGEDATVSRWWGAEQATSGVEDGWRDARLEFPTTNNTAEYEAIMLALRKARAMGAQCLVIHTDSQVVAGHIDKSYQARSPELAKYLEAFRKAEACFRGITVSGVPRATIADVDALAKAAAGSTLLPSHVLYEVLRSPAASDTDAPAAEVAVIDT
ncbi:hypothetical protein OsJ_00987 [Oryza sativa Japonica Group]|uniref:RNase H type-1 domain-containing protein n=1 Tax=Oryza sativa subsp. japonica TaxID=39947 RepID=A2ZQZ1_ORYSJ|nr:hypothetical protein OsJ_00987 [Oryza sativa Japonica Group]